MDYTSALHHVLGLADSERMTDSPVKRPRYNLSRMIEFMHQLGDPQRRMRTVHVTGTKGKGSTSAMIASMLGNCGFTVGLYTSPHLHTMRERIRINGEPVSEVEFAELVGQVWPSVKAIARSDVPERVTTFETLTGMALAVFAKHQLDFQVLEVGKEAWTDLYACALFVGCSL